ncbi:Cadherin-87A, partial [Gryllus bimaculatus]
MSERERVCERDRERERECERAGVGCAGEVSLARPMEELLEVTRPCAPLLLTLLAEEVRPSPSPSGAEAPAASSEAVVALLLDDRANHPPYFASSDYDVHISENSPMGTALNFQPPYEAVIHDDNIGKQGLFSIELTDSNGTFEVTPAVGEGRTNFIIAVRDSSLLDYEQREHITFQVHSTSQLLYNIIE